MTVHDLRQRWPRAEAMLEAGEEIIVTRDGKPVARLVRFVTPRSRRKRLDPEAQAKWQAAASRGQAVRWVEEFLLRDRSGQ